MRARTALRTAGLDPTVKLHRASSVTNEVWLTDTHSVRVNRHPDNRLNREALVAAVLYVATGSLLWPIVLHAAVDLQGGAIGRRVLASGESGTLPSPPP